MNSLKVIFDFLQMILISFLVYELSLQVFFFGDLLNSTQRLAVYAFSFVYFLCDFLLNFCTGFFEEG